MKTFLRKYGLMFIAAAIMLASSCELRAQPNSGLPPPRPASSVAAGATGTTAVKTDSSTVLATTAFVNGQPRMISSLASDQTSLSNNTTVKVLLPAATIDNATGFSAVTHVYTIPTAGTYRISASCTFSYTSVASGQHNCYVSKNGTVGGSGVTVARGIQSVPIATGATTTVPVATALVVFAASDTVELDANPQGSSSLSLNSSAGFTQLSLEWVGP